MHRRWWGVAGATISLLAVPASATARVSAPPAEGPCARFGAVRAGVAVEDGDLVELSGLAASRAHTGVLWANDDSGAGPELHAIGPSGEDLGTFALPGARAVDWEDLAAAPGPDPGSTYLYVADIGDNDERREHVTVYRVPEPAAAPDGRDSELEAVEALDLVYPGGAANAEALLVDPVAGDVVIITKSLFGTSHVLVATGAARRRWTPAGATTETEPERMDDAGVLRVPPLGTDPRFPGTMVTAADVTPDGSMVLVRTYGGVLAVERRDGESVAEALLRGQPCTAPAADEPQGEAIAWAADGSRFVTASEVGGAIEDGALPPGATPVLSWVHVQAAPATTPPATTPPATTSPSTTPSATNPPAATAAAAPATTSSGRTGGSSSSSAAVVVGALVVAVVAAAVVVLRRCRR